MCTGSDGQVRELPPPSPVGHLCVCTSSYPGSLHLSLCVCRTHLQGHRSRCGHKACDDLSDQRRLCAQGSCFVTETSAQLALFSAHGMSIRRRGLGAAFLCCDTFRTSKLRARPDLCSRCLTRPSGNLSSKRAVCLSVSKTAVHPANTNSRSLLRLQDVREIQALR